MSQPAEDIDRIVREVLARITEVAPRQTEGNEGSVTLSGRVVTLADVENRLAGKSAIRISPGAVVTPAVKDYLKDHGVRLEYGAARDWAIQTGITLVIGVAETRYDPSELLRLLGRHDIDLDQAAQRGLVPVVDALADRMRRANNLALLLTDADMVAICLANRLAGVRAAAVRDLADVRRAGESIAANVLVVKPAGMALFALEQMVLEFCRGGVRRCAEKHSGRLD